MSYSYLLRSDGAVDQVSGGKVKNELRPAEEGISYTGVAHQVRKEATACLRHPVLLLVGIVRP